MLKVVDFTDFVKRFELPSKIEGEESKEKREKLFKKIASTIQFVPAKRANNMSKSWGVWLPPFSHSLWVWAIR